MTIIDADGAILGRLSSHVAKRLLNGEEITVINADKILLTGSVEENYKQYYSAYNKGKSLAGPEYPRLPDRILRRTVRGMLPIKTTRGKDALGRLKAYIGSPKELASEVPEKIALAPAGRRYVKLVEISKLLGAKVNE